MKFEYAALTHTGQVRENNEDSHGEFFTGQDETDGPVGGLFVVADGMGGHRGGGTASQLAVEALGRAYANHNGGDLTETLVGGFSEANRVIVEKSVADASLFGMGTTCTAVGLVDGQAYFAHVGDSRAYFLRGGNIEQVTVDHSLVGEMVRSGILSDEDARNHPKRNVITRSLGIQEQITTDTPRTPLMLAPGDKILICSDGLTSYVSDEEMQQAMDTETVANAAQTLVDLANSRGGRDNITVQVIHILTT